MIHHLREDIWRKRSSFRRLTRDFLERRDYLEVDTPHLLQHPSLEPHLDPYPVILEDSRRGHLNTSPEVNLKKLLGATDLEKIYELAHSYRSFERGRWHRSEFTMLEWYAKGYTLSSLLKEVADFMSTLFPKLPNHIFSVDDWFQEHLGIKPTLPEMRALLEENGAPQVTSMDWDECFFRLFLPTESKMASMGTVFLKEYPPELSSYSTIKGGKAQRFEVYVKGIEVGNAYEERTSREDMQRQLEKEQNERKKLKKNPLNIDQSFVGALDEVEGPVSGIAMGWDRLFALWCGHDDLSLNCPYPNWAEFSSGH